MPEDIKNILPIDNINPQEAVTTLSKDKSGSYIVVFIVLIIALLGFIVYLAINSNPQCSEEKAALRADNAILQKRIMYLEQNRDYERMQKEVLQDSVRKYQIIEQFNSTEGPKQIILETKKNKQ
ncbi:hypothetical protein ABDK00_016835 [Niabella insulamsoli]|uniref:hypothetical protein n=1 Tax=Niabella insulamsoli TaxID=3144874 RepID=UPI0031FC6719